MGRKSPYLQLRGGTYAFRVRVPDDLRPHLGKREIKKSLRTTDAKEAQQLARLERVKLDAEWAALRRKLAPKPATVLSEVEVWRLTSKWFVEAEKASLGEPLEMSLHEAEVELSQLSDWDVSGSIWYSRAARALAEEGWTVDPASPASPAFLQLQRGLQQAEMEVLRRAMLRAFPGTQMALDPNFASLTANSVVQPVAKKLTLAQLMETIRSDPSRRTVRGKTEIKREAHWRVIGEFFGEDIAVEAISRSQVKEFMALLERLPSNASKHFPEATIFEAVELAEQRKLPRLSAETANGYLRALGGLFRYAIHDQLVSSDPSVGLLFQKDKVRRKDKRLPFDAGDLCAIFAAPLFTGCLDDERGYSLPGPEIVRRGRFWVPLIALFSGMRLNEICQLTADDFVRDDGADIILIRNDDDDETKRVKTDAGVRFVPVHPELVRIGLLDHVEKRRGKDGHKAAVFPELPIGSTGYRSDPFSKFFARFLDHVGVRHPKKVFHSFRHNYRDALREADISIEKVRALGGWTSGRTEDDYGRGLRASTLAEAIKEVRYPELDLSHLHVR